MRIMQSTKTRLRFQCSTMTERDACDLRRALLTRTVSMSIASTVFRRNDSLRFPNEYVFQRLALLPLKGTPLRAPLRARAAVVRAFDASDDEHVEFSVDVTGISEAHPVTAGDLTTASSGYAPVYPGMVLSVLGTGQRLAFTARAYAIGHRPTTVVTFAQAGNRLEFFIETDGSVSPADAVAQVDPQLHKKMWPHIQTRCPTRSPTSISKDSGRP